MKKDITIHSFIGVIGEDVKSLLDSSRVSIHEARGAKSALIEAISVIQPILDAVDSEVDEGSDIVKSWIRKSQHALENLATREELKIAQAMGREQALVKSLEAISSRYNAAFVVDASTTSVDTSDIDLTEVMDHGQNT